MQGSAEAFRSGNLSCSSHMEMMNLERALKYIHAAAAELDPLPRGRRGSRTANGKEGLQSVDAE